MMVSGILAQKGFHAFDAETKVVAGQKMLHIWVIVANREEAFVYRKTASGLEEIGHVQAKGKQLKSVSDHTFAPQGMASHEHASPHHEKSRPRDVVFTKKLVEWLDVAEKEKAFDEIVLVAAPYTLGNIRENLTKNLKDRVRAELNKELTNMPPQEIQKHLDKIM